MNHTVADVRFYWRPGCPFCIRLRRQLNKAGVDYRDINIWEDTEAAATVRSVAGGNETVPTVFVGRTGMVNPSIKAVLTEIGNQFPASAPTGAPTGDTESTGLLSRIVNRLRRV